MRSTETDKKLAAVLRLVRRHAGDDARPCTGLRKAVEEYGDERVSEALAFFAQVMEDVAMGRKASAVMDIRNLASVSTREEGE